MLTRSLGVLVDRLNTNVLDGRMSTYRDDASRVEQTDWIVKPWCVRRCVVIQEFALTYIYLSDLPDVVRIHGPRTKA